jgi:hypothetical protein
MPSRKESNNLLPRSFTAKLQKALPRADGHLSSGRNRFTPFETSFMALGNGTHKLPVKAEARRAIDKAAGGTVGLWCKFWQKRALGVKDYLLQEVRPPGWRPQISGAVSGLPANFPS